MGTAFWLRRFLLVFGIAFVVIAASQWLQGEALNYVLTQALLWAAISSAIFTVSRLYQSRRGIHCALCQDIPESSAAGNTDA